MRPFTSGCAWPHPPFDYSGVAYDPDARLTCLVDKTNAGCGQAQPDVKGLIGQQDATYAVLDYYRRVKPEGVACAGGFCAQLPSASVTNRIASFACPTDNNGTYTQNFNFTMQVTHRIDRYLVFPDGRKYFIQSFKDVVTSPSTTVSSSSPITRNGTYLTLSTNFLQHITNAWVTTSAYAPNAVSLGGVTLQQPASCGCPTQNPYTETHNCSELNASWTGTFTRHFTWNTSICNYTSSDDTSTCDTSGPPPPPPPPPPVSCTLTANPASILQANTSTLTAVCPGAVSIAWSNPPGAPAFSGTGGTGAFLNTGNFTYCVQGYNGTSYGASACATVVVGPRVHPTATPTVQLCLDYNIRITANSNGVITGQTKPTVGLGWMSFTITYTQVNDPVLGTYWAPPITFTQLNGPSVPGSCGVGRVNETLPAWFDNSTVWADSGN